MENEIVQAAIKYICNNDGEFASRMRQEGVAHAVYKMLRNEGYDLQNLHRTGDLRRILSVFI